MTEQDFRQALHGVMAASIPPPSMSAAAMVRAARRVRVRRRFGWTGAGSAVLAANQVFQRNLAHLRAAGVTVLFGPDVLEPHPPRTAGTRLDAYPWHLALDAVER